jgi:hypothetical protein
VGQSIRKQRYCRAPFGARGRHLYQGQGEPFLPPPLLVCQALLLLKQALPSHYTRKRGCSLCGYLKQFNAMRPLQSVSGRKYRPRVGQR